jgi:hypothetical protein
VYASAVEHCAVVVDEHVFAQMDFCAVVAVEGWTDECGVRDARDELFDYASVFVVCDSHSL